jgi:hypothetical protein
MRQTHQFPRAIIEYFGQKKIGINLNYKHNHLIIEEEEIIDIAFQLVAALMFV